MAEVESSHQEQNVMADIKDEEFPENGSLDCSLNGCPPGKECCLQEELVVSSQASNGRRMVGEDPEHFLGRLTHINLSNRNLFRMIPKALGRCYALQVLYLYDNRIRRLEGLEAAVNITHLYLQNNDIESLEGLQNLPRLQKLYADDNCIQRIEGLERSTLLEELHVSRQRLPDGESLVFDPQTMAQLSGCLKVVGASQCGLTEIGVLQYLPYIQKLDLSRNDIKHIQEVEELLGRCPKLERLDLRENPVCRERKYHDRLILASQPNFASLDGRDVLAHERTFLMRLADRRLRNPQKNEDEDLFETVTRELQQIVVSERKGPQRFPPGKTFTMRPKGVLSQSNVSDPSPAGRASVSGASSTSTALPASESGTDLMLSCTGTRPNLSVSSLRKLR